MSSYMASGASSRASTSSDHSEIPSYPRSSHVEPSALSSSNAASSQSLAERKPDVQRTNPTFRQNGHHSLQSQRSDTTSTTAPFASANVDAHAPITLKSASSSRRTSPRKSATPARIGKDFEALLASDETYVLRETNKVALGTDEAAEQRLSASTSSNTNRVIVERRKQQASSSSSASASLTTDLDEADEEHEEVLELTPRPPQTDVFQPDQTVPPSSSSSAKLAGSRSVLRAVRGDRSRPPASPDRTTSLQGYSTASPIASSPASKRQAADMSAMPGFLIPPASEGANGTVRSRPWLGSSVGLEQEVASASMSQNLTESSASMGSFRQRMKKTSGFLRKLRKDNTAVRRDGEGAKPSGSSSVGHAYSMDSNASTTSLSRSGKSDSAVGNAMFARRGSKASIASAGASSITGSTSKSQLFASTDGVAVPSIPERFMQSSTSSNSISQSTAAPGSAEAFVLQQDVAGPAEAQQLAPQSKPALRVPSAPATLTEWSPAAKYALPQRSSSQGHEHERNKSLGSSDSTGAIQLAVQQLSSHMDDAWKEAPGQKIEVDASSPKRSWGPSPQLPDLDIQHDKQRSGSFLEEPVIASSIDLESVSTAAPETARSVTPTESASHRAADSKQTTGLGIQVGTASKALAPSAQIRIDSDSAQPDVEAAGSTASGSNSSNEAKRQPVHTLSTLQPTTSLRQSNQPSPPPTAAAAAPSPQRVNSSRSSRRNSIDAFADNAKRRTTDSGASLVSVRSFETAAESAGPGSADARVASFGLPAAAADAVRTASPKPRLDQARPIAGSTGAFRDLVPAESQAANGDVRLNIEDNDASNIDEDQEASIRVVTKRSNTEDIDLASESDNPGTSTIITAPDTPDMESSALPKMSQLSKSSLLRPGRNGSINRGGTTTLLSTASVHRSSSPTSSPASARTSFDHAAAARTGAMDPSASASATTSAQDFATKCWEEDPTFLKREKIAEWLGGLGTVNKAARSFYFGKFDFSNLRLDMAFRKLCDKLFLRAETQQIDRILAAFSQRYYECNPDSVFGSADVVHSVVFSILLLNTDLHIADLQERMTRQQFVRNTLGAIAESGEDDGRSSFSGANDRSTDAVPQTAAAQRRNSISSYLSRSKQASSTSNLESSVDGPDQREASKGKEGEIEVLLREIYAAVKSERILLPNPESSSGAGGRASGSFSPIPGGRRKGSDRMTALKRGSIRGIQGLLGGMDALSPNPSRSSVDSWGRPSQSLSTSGDRDRMLSPLPPITPGFASTLTQTIIKESLEEESATAAVSASSGRETDEEDDDDQLALAGPPWAKEGSLTRKVYWESANKRAKDKNWVEVFVVVSKGTLSMFRFDLASSSASGTNSKAKARGPPAAAALGGGNWLSNATCLGEIPLAHSLANALPPPGYNKSRPHVFALTLPGGKVFFFQTGHEELVNEWVTTCNYWAARQSKEPLAGGVSNMEYGWNKVLPQVEEDGFYEELDSFTTESGGRREDAGMPRASSRVGLANDGRSVQSGKSKPSASVSTSSNLGYLTNERTFINEWRTPELPTVASTLSEERQLLRLEKQVASIQLQLTQHNDLRQPMLHLYSPKGANHAKASANWERKSNWLLQELVKYQSYVESLKRSTDLKAERRAKREVEEMVRAGDEMLAELQI